MVNARADRLFCGHQQGRLDSNGISYPEDPRGDPRTTVGNAGLFQSLASKQADAALSPKKAKAKKKVLSPPPAPEDVEHCAVWWGSNDTMLVDAGGIQDMTWALAGWGLSIPKSIVSYSIVKNTSKNYEPGVSFASLVILSMMCPLHRTVRPAALLALRPILPSLCFPLKGLAPNCQIQLLQGRQPYPLVQLETSSPGLRGQSGGPIFNTCGRLWGIQTATAHLPLGFEPEFMEHGKMRRQQQFLNVGRGVHGETIQGLLNEIGVKFELSKIR